MRVILACLAMCLGAAALSASPPRESSLAASSLAANSAAVSSHGAARLTAATSSPVTKIAVNGNGGDRVYDGVGAILGGGGNARYLMDYPATQRSQILDYLFKPGYGASLQILKLEIGGDANSSDGSEPSIEHTAGHINCHAGYEFAIAKRAVARNKNLRIYGLQWAAPGWVRDGSTTKFTTRDITYLLNWLGCAKLYGLTVSYLDGWNETDNGAHQAWYHSLRLALNAHGYRKVQIVASDNGPTGWHYVGDRDVAILGTHDVCGFPTGIAGPATACVSPWSQHGRSAPSQQPMWASELGAMDAGAQVGCVNPCASAMDRATVRGYVDARLTGYLEWPALDAMPPGLPYENRGLLTADQPWSKSYQVNAMTWAIAQFTQFIWPPTAANPGGWKYVDSASGFLQRKRANGSYVSLVRSGGTEWSTIVEATTATATQRATFHITGGKHLAGKTVHVWASNLDPATDSPAQWFVRQPSIRPSSAGTFTLTIRPGWVYSLTTTSGQGKGAAAGATAAAFPLLYSSSLATSGAAGTADDEPPYLAAQDGSFELAPCAVRDGSDTTCTEQETVATPVFWHAGPTPRYPYAIIGDAGMANYTVSADVLLTQKNTSAGLIGRYSCRMSGSGVAAFDGYVFDVSAAGAWRLVSNANTKPTGSNCQTGGPTAPTTLASGTLAQPPGTKSWHRLSLGMSGSTITAAVDGTAVAQVSDSSWTSGPAGIEAGAGTQTWPQAQYSNLSITP
jgi:hypothetical protein